MTKQQPTLYSTLVDFINTIPVGETYTSEDFRKALTHITDFTGQQNTHGGRWYRVRSYQSYLKRIGALQNVKRGVWQVVYHIPHWLNLGIVELLLGYTCNKAMYPERIRLDEKKAKMLKDWNDYKRARDWSRSTIAVIKVGDKVIVTHKTKQWKQDSQRNNSWVSEMNNLIGKTCTVKSIDDNFPNEVVLEECIGRYGYPVSSVMKETVITASQFASNVIPKTSPIETKRVWEVGTEFVHHSSPNGTVYKIESIKKDYAQITWQGDSIGLSYDLTQVDDYFKEGTWIIKEQKKTTPKQNTRYTDTDMTEDWQTKARHQYKKGDKVLITHKHKDGEWYDNFNNKTSWPNEMDQWIGKAVTLNVENGGDWCMEETVYYFPTECMQPYTGEGKQAGEGDRLAGFLAELEILIAKWK